MSRESTTTCQRIACGSLAITPSRCTRKSALVRVEPHEASAANLYLKGQKDVARLVRELVRIVAPADSSLPPDTRKGAAA